MKLFLPSVVIVGLVALTAGAEERLRKAPAFRVADIGGNEVSLEELLGRGPVLVDFWATWCRPCVKELPHVQRLYEEHGERGLEVLAISIDSDRTRARIEPFLRDRKFTFRVLTDGDQKVFRRFGGKAIPYVVVIDSEGFIRYAHTGYRYGDEKELERVVLELLGDAPAEAEPADREEPRS